MQVRERVNLEWGWAEADAGAARVRIGDRLVPRVVAAHFTGADGQPALDLVLEVVNGVPQCRELRLTAIAGRREIKRLDLDAIHLTEWVEDLFALFASRIVSEEGGVTTSVMRLDDHVGAADQMRQARRGKSARKLTPDFLAGVADVYRAHLGGAPTQAVASAFGVQGRMASKYVQLARSAGLLPLTTPGKKKG